MVERADGFRLLRYRFSNVKLGLKGTEGGVRRNKVSEKVFFSDDNDPNRILENKQLAWLFYFLYLPVGNTDFASAAKEGLLVEWRIEVKRRFSNVEHPGERVKHFRLYATVESLNHFLVFWNLSFELFHEESFPRRLHVTILFGVLQKLSANVKVTLPHLN